VRTLTVVSPHPTEAEVAAKKQQEEAAAKKREEEAAAAVSGVSLAGSTITVKGGGEAAIKLTCTGTETCSGKLTLTVKGKGQGKKMAKPEALGNTGFSVLWGATATVELELNAAGRALLSAERGHCDASLAILELAPGPENVETQAVHLVQRKARGKAKK
jgi:hypothetical protein